MKPSDHICSDHLDKKCRCKICGETHHYFIDDDDGTFAASGKVAHAICIRCGYEERYYSDTGTVIDGGWFAPETYKVPKEAVDALVKASEHVVGASYHPVLLLGTKVVAGINYCMLCEVTPVTENAESHYAIVILSQGVGGTTSVLETYDFNEENAE